MTQEEIAKVNKLLATAVLVARAEQKKIGDDRLERLRIKKYKTNFEKCLLKSLEKWETLRYNEGAKN